MMNRDTSNIFWKLIVIYLGLTAFLTARASAQETVIWEKTDAAPYTHAAFSHGGSILALGREDTNTSDFLNSNDGTLIRSYSGNHNGTNALVFTLDDQYIVSGTGAGGATLTLDLWRVSDGVRIFRLGDHNNGDHAVSLSPDGQYVATSGRFAREINIWHVPDMTQLISIPNTNDFGSTSRVKDVAFSPDGQTVASSDAYGIKFWNPFTGAVLLSISTPEARSIAFSPDGQFLAAATESEQAVKLFSTSNGSLVRKLTVDTQFGFPVIAFSPSGRVLAAGYNTGSDAGALKFWSSKGTVIDTIEKPGSIISVAFAPKGGKMAYTQFGGHITVSSFPFLR
jgi:WD40 repeat protein